MTAAGRGQRSAAVLYGTVATPVTCGVIGPYAAVRGVGPDGSVSGVHIGRSFRNPWKPRGVLRLRGIALPRREGDGAHDRRYPRGRPQLKHAPGELTTSPRGRLMGAIGKRMEPIRVSIRLFGDVRSTTPK